MPNLIVFRPKSAAYDPIYTSNIDHNIPVGGHACCASHYRFFAVGWKPIIFDFLEQKNQSFWNKSGKTQPIRRKFGIRGQVKGWQRSGNFGRDRPILGKMGAGTSPAEPEIFLFGKPRDLSGTSQRPIFTNFGHETKFGVPSMNPERHFRKFSLWGSFAPKIWHQNYVKQAPHSEQATGHAWWTAERYCLLHVVVQRPGGFQRLVNIFVRCAVAELRGVKVA